jgi:Leucine-rich repeat (LRR) protein
MAACSSSNSKRTSGLSDRWQEMKICLPKGPIRFQNIIRRIENEMLTASAETQFESFAQTITRGLNGLQLLKEAQSFEKSFKVWTSFQPSLPEGVFFANIEGLDLANSQQFTSLSSLNKILKRIQKIVGSHLEDQALIKLWGTHFASLTHPNLGHWSQEVRSHLPDHLMFSMGIPSGMPLAPKEIREKIHSRAPGGIMLRALSTPKMGLATLPKETTLFPQLEYINFSWQKYDNPLSFLPSCLGDFKHLQTLLINGNALTYLPKSIGELEQLVVLDASSNCLTELPSSFSQLMNLVRLDLSYNEFLEVPPFLGKCKNLKGLGLAGNHLTCLPETFSNLSQLKVLDISENQFVFFPSNVIVLSISDFDLTQNPLAVFNDQKKLRCKTNESFQELIQEDREQMIDFTGYECRSALSRLYKSLIILRESNALRTQFEALPKNQQNRILLKGRCKTADEFFALDFPRVVNAIKSAVEAVKEYTLSNRLDDFDSFNILQVIDAIDKHWPGCAARRVLFPSELFKSVSDVSSSPHPSSSSTSSSSHAHSKRQTSSSTASHGKLHSKQTKKRRKD